MAYGIRMGFTKNFWILGNEWAYYRSELYIKNYNLSESDYTTWLGLALIMKTLLSREGFAAVVY